MPSVDLVSTGSWSQPSGWYIIRATEGGTKHATIFVTASGGWCYGVSSEKQDRVTGAMMMMIGAFRRVLRALFAHLWSRMLRIVRSPFGAVVADAVPVTFGDHPTQLRFSGVPSPTEVLSSTDPWSPRILDLVRTNHRVPASHAFLLGVPNAGCAVDPWLCARWLREPRHLDTLRRAPLHVLARLGDAVTWANVGQGWLLAGTDPEVASTTTAAGLPFPPTPTALGNVAVVAL